ncbi:MAG: hypothetical protein ACM3RX_05995 [Methanococcaceae archaeon]
MKNNMHLTEFEISQYSDALRSKTEDNLPVDILEHVEECLECKHAVMELISLVNEIEESDDVKPVLHLKPIPEKGYAFYLKAAAAAFIIVMSGYLFITNRSIENRESASVIKKETIQKVDTDKKELEKVSKPVDLADNTLYSPIPEYEAICGDSFRSEKADIISPALSEKSRGQINFNISFTKKGGRSLTVFNNKNKAVMHKDFDTVSFKQKSNFTPGLYYWKLETSEDLLYIGKFIIEK